jgi:2'-5' RNA ligase
MRIFTAIALPPDFFEPVGESLNALRHAHLDLRLTPPQNLHITVAFLGEMEGAQIEKLKLRIEKAAAACKASRFRTGTLLTLSRGKALAVSVEPENAELAKLAGLVGTEARFSPHITIARSSRPIKLSPEEQRLPFSVEGAADKVTIFSSDLKRSGPVYTKLAEFFLLQSTKSP